jgi:predicted lipoprotein
LAENVESVKDVFNGGNGAGMDDYLNALDVKDDEGLLLTKKINQQFDKVINIARSIEEDLSSAIINQNPKLDELYLEMINLTIIIKNDMMSQLGLLTVFSDNDGD